MKEENINWSNECMETTLPLNFKYLIKWKKKISIEVMTHEYMETTLPLRNQILFVQKCSLHWNSDLGQYKSIYRWQSTMNSNSQSLLSLQGEKTTNLYIFKNAMWTWEWQVKMPQATINQLLLAETLGENAQLKPSLSHNIDINNQNFTWRTC